MVRRGCPRAHHRRAGAARPLVIEDPGQRSRSLPSGRYQYHGRSRARRVRQCHRCRWRRCTDSNPNGVCWQRWRQLTNVAGAHAPRLQHRRHQYAHLHQITVDEQSRAHNAPRSATMRTASMATAATVTTRLPERQRPRHRVLQTVLVVTKIIYADDTSLGRGGARRGADDDRARAGCARRHPCRTGAAARARRTTAPARAEFTDARRTLMPRPASAAARRCSLRHAEATPSRWFRCEPRALSRRAAAADRRQRRAARLRCRRSAARLPDLARQQLCALGSVRHRQQALRLPFRPADIDQYITPDGVGALDPPGALVGFGLGDYGTDAYGRSRDPADIGPRDISASQGDIWSLATFGEDLLIVPTAGRPPVRLVADHAHRPCGAGSRGAGPEPRRHRHRPASGRAARARRRLAAQLRLVRSRRTTTSGHLTWPTSPAQATGDAEPALTAVKVTTGLLIFTSQRRASDAAASGRPAPMASCRSRRAAGRCRAVRWLRSGNLVMWPGLQQFWPCCRARCPADEVRRAGLVHIADRAKMIGRVFGSPNAQFSRGVVGLGRTRVLPSATATSR